MRCIAGMRRLRLLLPPLLVIAATGTGRAESYVPEAGEELDLLIVVDSSPGMADELGALAPQIAALVADISADFTNDDGVDLSLHVAVVTADLGAGSHPLAGCALDGDGAKLQAAPATCNGPTGRFLSREVSAWGEVDANYSGTLAEAVDCMIPRAADGCVVQQPLAAARRALDGTVTDNLGFLRPTAALAILVVSNQEDCSTGSAETLFDPAASDAGPATSYRCAAQGWTCSPPIDGTAQAHTGCYVAAASPLSDLVELQAGIRETKSEPWRIAVGVVRGPSEPVAVAAGPAIAPSCGGDAPRAGSPGLRLDAYANLFDHRFVASVCEDALDPFRDAVHAAVYDPGPPPDGDAGYGWCDGGFGGQDAGDEGGFPFEGDGGCSSGGAGGTRTALILLALMLFRPRSGRCEPRKR